MFLSILLFTNKHDTLFLNESKLKNKGSYPSAPCDVLTHHVCTQNMGNSSNFGYREISSSHGGEYDVQSCLLGYTAM
jgi:hypothetical protein